ncbi:MAG: hypothetical protein GY696_09430 [Gammaproteobacteria bacterium]|nr:hypothetical protein [Gammaproteobacteria bacterium]
MAAVRRDMKPVYHCRWQQENYLESLCDMQKLIELNSAGMYNSQILQWRVRDPLIWRRLA